MRNALFLCLLTGVALNACTTADKMPEPVVRASALTTAPTGLLTGTAYYVSNAGADTNPGTEAAPFKTLDRVNQLTLSHGDRIYLAAGQTFAGTLALTGNANTQSGDPVYVATYGTDTTKAVIQPAPGSPNGIKVTDFAGVDLRNLELEGSGSGAIGVEVVASANAATAIAHTRLTGLEVRGFTKVGISLHAQGTKGLDDAVVTRCQVHDCGENGIFMYADQWPAMPSKNLLISNCYAYRIRGNSSNTQTNTGNGILVSGVMGAVVEHSRASDNGANNGHEGGGPMGIWCYDAAQVTIQFCESDHNHRSRDADGGGFDIDGGSRDCVIQYCYSHDNEGEGYGLFEFGSPNPFTNNVVKFNISANDGEGIAFWAKDGYKLRNSYAYNNTVVGALGFRLDNNNFEGVYAMNNLYVGPRFQDQNQSNLYFYSNIAVSSFNFVNGYQLPAGSPLSSAGANLDPVYNDRDYYQAPLNGVFPMGASK
jgi:hypothetical protein